ncbi:MAG: Holliday junction resolvase RuvX [Firmicutes bacterium]|uniref:Putative pre-16S rRNA nuclease n=1 Tax=Candidatus Gallilactobacillus intestinavium TaxID=2840838 RepID=A0A9D9E519_9LACO|nr:Holliday junction resolvase RuvX [Candidatus Gallilactobacillus intestinavium]
MRLMGLDVGSKTVGVAVSDPLGWTAQGITVISIDENQNDYGLDELSNLVNKYDITKFVLGLPKNMNNSSGERVLAVKHYGEIIKSKFHKDVDYIDERLTTVEAERMLVEEGNVSREKRRKKIDKVAATLILQNYLDLKGNI